MGTFLKAQTSSIISTLADFLFTLFFTEIIGMWYLVSSSIGTIIGGCVNFSLGRNWVFNAKRSNRITQAKKYIMVWTGSLILNSSGVYLLTDTFRIHYIISKSVITVLVGVFFNFYFQRSFVFKAQE
jgi:putative flippase GtrA